MQDRGCQVRHKTDLGYSSRPSLSSCANAILLLAKPGLLPLQLAGDRKQLLLDTYADDCLWPPISAA